MTKAHKTSFDDSYIRVKNIFCFNCGKKSQIWQHTSSAIYSCKNCNAQFIIKKINEIQGDI